MFVRVIFLLLLPCLCPRRMCVPTSWAFVPFRIKRDYEQFSVAIKTEVNERGTRQCNRMLKYNICFLLLNLKINLTNAEKSRYLRRNRLHELSPFSEINNCSDTEEVLSMLRKLKEPTICLYPKPEE
jgi:hypothetical protein